MQRLREQAGPDFRDIVIVSTIADAGGTPADGMDTMSMALELLLEQVRDERVTSALRVARRVGEQTASRLERGPERVL